MTYSFTSLHCFASDCDISNIGAYFLVGANTKVQYGIVDGDLPITAG